MAKTPEFVVTGLHVPKVHFWARVLVAPERLQRVKHGILTMGQVFLKPGERLEIDTCPGEDIERALTAGDPDTKPPFGPCLAAWNGTGDVTVYADDADHAAAIAEPVTTALVTRQPFERMDRAVWLHSDRIASIRVGDVHVYFERSEDRAKEGPADEEEADHAPKEWRQAAREVVDFDFRSDANCGMASVQNVIEAQLQVAKAIRALRKACLLTEAV